MRELLADHDNIYVSDTNQSYQQLILRKINTRFECTISLHRFQIFKFLPMSIIHRRLRKQ